jgi:perosamine synthetase
VIPISRPLIGPEERAAADRVLASGALAQGPEVEAFEAEFSAWVDGRECVAVSAGTAALHLGLLAAGVGPGDEVIVPSFTFAATANAVALCGARPVFADIEARSFCLDPAGVDAAVTPSTAAVVAVHLYGHPADLPALEAVCSRHGLLLVEDAAQAHGARLDGRAVGSWGAVGMFSFYPTKNMTTGEGGMITTADPEIARTARLLRNQGMADRYRNELVGFNARMTDVAAAIGRVQLGRLAGFNAARQANAARYDAELTGVVTPPVPAGAEHVYHQYTVRAPDRDLLAKRLADAGIDTGVYYPVPVHRLAAFGLDLDLPETERAAAEVLSLPVRPDLSADEVGAVIEAVNGA